MKPKPALLVLWMAMPPLFLACKKSKKEANTPAIDGNEELVIPTGEPAKIMGKRQIMNITTNIHFAGGDLIETYNGSAAAYTEVRNNDKLYAFFNSNSDVSIVAVRIITQISINGDPADVKILTASQLQIDDKDKTGMFGFTEVTYDLKSNNELAFQSTLA